MACALAVLSTVLCTSYVPSTHWLCISFDYNTVTHLPGWTVDGARPQMENLIGEYAKCGVRRIFYRCSILGREATRIDEIPLFEGAKGWKPALELLLGTGADPYDWFVEACKRNNIEPWAWITLEDSGDKGPLADPFFTAHPEYLLQNRDGTAGFPGHPCYAYPEARAHRVREAVEIAAKGGAGILFDLRSHSSARGDYNVDWGFNQPIVDEYTKRYGKDPRELALMRTEDGVRFAMLKTEYYTQLLQDIRAAIPRRPDGGLTRIMMAVEPTVFPKQWSTPKITNPEEEVRTGAVDELLLLQGNPSWIGEPAQTQKKTPMTLWWKVYGGGMDTNKAIVSMFDKVMHHEQRENALCLFEASRLWEQSNFDTMRQAITDNGWSLTAPLPGHEGYHASLLNLSPFL
jgi:hypothetical protein